MTIKSFLKYVEAQTKVASVIPFILGTLYTLYRYESFSFINFVIMFISLLSFDMATTAINNYIDYKKAHKLDGYNYQVHNAIVRDGISERTARNVIFVLLTIASVCGIVLTLRTSIVVLLIGAISFAVGVFYTFGPMPISRMPLGEVFSGFFMGFVIMFLSIYIHVYDQNIVSLLYQSGMVTLNVNILEVAKVFLMSIPAVGGIANIMLANNICDLEEDIVNKRFTLTYYIGKKNALLVFRSLYYIGFADIILLVLLGIAPAAMLIVLVTFIPVNKALKVFDEKQLKGETFVLSVKNFVMMHVTQIAVLAIVLVANQVFM